MSKRAVIGAVLLLFGVYLFLGRTQDYNTGQLFATFWPTMFVIPLGLFFHWMHFSLMRGRGHGLLIPGGVLITAGLVSQIAMLFGNWNYMWPGFILAPAVGLFEYYWFGNRNKWLLLPIQILTVLSVLFFVIFTLGHVLGQLSGGQSMIGILLIALGAYLLVARRRGRA
ncbi:hypothetical protein PA598K_06290 [Paenibacillus sp. 598K]|uniref:hypothetical protein n=1 Tax=Paenibacillus sp. 598K TaxID=1117987 RepID=UPI000FFAA47B|nr:hypothetical protein [Paenibacillus sp. 598K]GBF77727.1 hypothetical protein PA598K_06290 [Paenibacillus sp. 598K]